MKLKKDSSMAHALSLAFKSSASITFGSFLISIVIQTVFNRIDKIMAAIGNFRIRNYFLRFFIALILVFVTFNPSEISYVHWVKADIHHMLAQKLFVGVILLIGWVMFIRATINSLGAPGLFLAAAFFGTLIWVLVDWNVLPLKDTTAITYVVEIVLAAVLATGMSWSHIRRRLSGQVDTDEIEG